MTEWCTLNNVPDEPPKFCVENCEELWERAEETQTHISGGCGYAHGKECEHDLFMDQPLVHVDPHDPLKRIFRQFLLCAETEMDVAINEITFICPRTRQDADSL